MSLTTVQRNPAPHVLVRRLDARGRGSWHAAISVETFAGLSAWRTACGRELEHRGSEHVFGPDAFAVLESDAALCAGCDRVGLAT